MAVTEEALRGLAVEAGLEVEERAAGWRVGREGGPFVDVDRIAVVGARGPERLEVVLGFPLVHPAVRQLPAGEHHGERGEIDLSQPEDLVLDGFRTALRHVAAARPVRERPTGARPLAARGAELLATIDEARGGPLAHSGRGAGASNPPAPLPRSPDPRLDELVAAALAVRVHAYAPYSKFAVGAAVRTTSGRLFTGVNIENASYPLGMCAERVAVSAAVAAGERALVAVAVATGGSPPSSPCGGCRQVLAEFARDLPVVLVNDRGERVETSLAALLPRAFSGGELPA